MINIKLELKNVVEQTMIPESKAFLDELNELISSNNACNDDIEAKKDMESFLQELNTILNAPRMTASVPRSRPVSSPALPGLGSAH